MAWSRRAISFLTVLVAATHVFATSQEGRYQAAIREGQDALRAMVEARHTPGVSVAVGVNGRVVWSQGFGMADLSRGIPATTDTMFGVGSVSKSFTMAAAVRLMARGRLDLDAPVERYLPDFPHRGRGITVRRLAAHQSGMSDAFAVEHYATARHFATLDSAYQAIKTGAIEYTPGTRTVYATGLYTIIGRVLEAVSGQSFPDLMRETIFEPAGMRHTMANDPRGPLPARTVFYAAGESGTFTPGPYVDPSHKLPGAGYLATARDVAAFGLALLDPEFIGREQRRDLFATVPLADGTPTEYALGFRSGADAHGRVIHQPGGGIGISAWLFIYPDRHLVVALLANEASAPVGGRAARRIIEAFVAAD